MSDPKETIPVSTYKPAKVDERDAGRQPKLHVRLSESGVPESLWETPKETGTRAPFSHWQPYPKQLYEPPLTHSDNKPGDLFRHVERINEKSEVSQGPLNEAKDPKGKEGKVKIPMW